MCLLLGTVWDVDKLLGNLFVVIANLFSFSKFVGRKMFCLPLWEHIGRDHQIR